MIVQLSEFLDNGPGQKVPKILRINIVQPLDFPITVPEISEMIKKPFPRIV